MFAVSMKSPFTSVAWTARLGVVLVGAGFISIAFDFATSRADYLASIKGSVESADMNETEENAGVLET